jgi:DHA1 family multidrug resistance protein-like MFS transporter
MASWKKSFNALWIAELFAIAGFSTSNPMLPIFLTEIGVHDPVALNWWTGSINGVSSLALAILAPIWGALADSYGRKLMLLRAMIGGSILMGLLALTNSPWQVLFIKTLQGCITGTVAAATVLTASIVPASEIGYRLGLMQMAVFVGNSLGPMFGGFITDVAGSRLSFVATSVLLAIAAVMVHFNVSEEFIPAPKTSSFLRNAIPDFSVLKKNLALQALMIVVFMIQFANAVVGPIIPLVVIHLNSALQGAGSLSGLIIGVASIGGALGSVLTGKISGKTGYNKALLVCIAGSFLFYIPQGFVTEPWHLIVLRFLSGFFMGGTMPTVNALIAEQADKTTQGGIYGLSSSVSSAGNAVGPAFGAFAASAFGYPSVFFSTTVFLGILGVWVSGRVMKFSWQRSKT